MDTTSIRFEPPSLDDAALLLAWRTDPAIAQHMFSEISPDLDRQRAWLDGCRTRTDFRHFIISGNGKPVGYASYSSIDPWHQHCISGSYVAVVDQRTAVGTWLQWFIMDYAFYRLGMNKVISLVLDSNHRQLRMLRLLKEREVGVLHQHIRKTDGWHDVHLFELLLADWERQPRPFTIAETLAAFAVEEPPPRSARPTS